MLDSRIRSVLLGVAVVALMGMFGSTAGAAVTKTRITAPSTDPTIVTYTGASTPTLAVAGTSNGGKAALDLRCDGGTSTLLQQNIIPTASGAWGFGLSYKKLGQVAASTCVLRAVPHGKKPANPAPFVGIRLGVDASRAAAVTGGPNNGAVYDFTYTATQLDGRATLASAGACGLAGSGVYTPNVFAATQSPFDCDAHLPANLGGRSAVLVDNQSAYLPAGADALFANAANGGGFSPLTYSVSLDGATGNVAIQDSEPLVKCAPQPTAVPASPATCSSFVSAGVRLDRRIIQQGDGRLTLFFDTWVSTDGKTHKLDLFYENHIKGPAPVFSFPWAGGFQGYPPGFQAPAPTSDTTSFYLKPGPNVRDNDPTYAQGAISFQRKPTAIRFRDSSTVWLQYLRTVSKSTKGTVYLGYSRAKTSGDLSVLVRQAESALSLPSCRVPRVINKSLGAARSALGRAHCLVGKIIHQSVRHKKKNTVISQGPKAGSVLAYHGKVTLHVSR